jgi:DNA-binding MarR family transcriptional regulator
MKKLESAFFSLFEMSIAIHALNKTAERKLGLSVVQWCLLRKLLDMPSCSAQGLAKAVGVHPSTLTQTLKRLEKKKLLFVAEDPRDSRKKLISLTRAGRDLLAEIEQRDLSWFPFELFPEKKAKAFSAELRA